MRDKRRCEIEKALDVSKRGNIFEDDNGLGCIGPCGVMNAEKLRTARKASAA